MRNPYKAKSLKNETNVIINALKSSPNRHNKALDKINSENVVFILLQYNKTTGRNLARDIINNGDPNSATVCNKICWHLAKRAQELDVKGVYFSGYLDETNPEKLIKWIENAQSKIFAAERTSNPAIADEFENKKYVQKVNNFSNLKNSGKYLATKLFNEIYKIGSNKNKTEELLTKITPENAAFVVSEYSNLECNKKRHSLAQDIDDELRLNITHVKKYICKNLVAQAKSLGITGIYHSDYNKINNIDELSQWIFIVSQKIINVTADNSVRTEKTETTTRRQGDYNIKTVTKGELFKEANLSKIEEKYDRSGKLVDKTYYYNDGKIVREFQDAKRGRVRELVKAGATKKDEEAPKITEAVPMTISLPPDASDNAKAFAKALETNKAELMAKLGLDNDTYDRLAKLAMAIAEQETNFGNNGGMYRSGKYGVGKFAPDTPLHDWSYGPTQIKFELQKKDEWIADKFTKFGLHEGLQLYNIKNSAIATMIVLAQNNRIIKNNKKYQDAMEAARGNIVYIDGWEMKNGTLTNTYNTKPFVNEVTDEDAICYLWNGRGAAIKDGTMEPESLEYTRNVHKFLKKYSIEESQEQRKIAIAKSKDKQAAKNFKPMDNNGPIGSIVFMPKMYKGNIGNKQDELEILKTSLSKNPRIKEESKQALIQAVENGEIGFEFGLTQKEADSLTQKDVDMLLKHLNGIKSELENEGIDFSDGISESESAQMASKWQNRIRQVEADFKREYMNSISPVVSISNIDARNVLMTPLNNGADVSRTRRNDRSRRGFVGYHNDKGVNAANTSQASAVLAGHAKNVANDMRTSGYCMTGFRRALNEAGVDTSDLSESKPRASVKFFERHPDMFEEVKFVNIGGGKSRQINSTDLPNLPAGYIVVWVPDADSKHANAPGHISITNGNGEAYSDETDNLNWGVYAKENDAGNGKGEHGTFRVFRLTNKWDVDPETKKLIFKG